VLDDLYVSAVSFDDGEKRAVLITVDICQLSTEQCRHARRLVNEQTGIAKAAVKIAEEVEPIVIRPWEGFI